MTTTTYNALYIAAERMGRNNYASQKAAHVKAGRSPKTFRFSVTPEHDAIVKAMGDRHISDNDAMALLHGYEAMKQRLAC
jgi:hypothetical protein